MMQICSLQKLIISIPTAHQRLFGDMAEIKAIWSIFGEHVKNINISSTKSMTGHCLGAAGAVEAIACIKSINESIVPPTINHFTDDPEFEC